MISTVNKISMLKTIVMIVMKLVSEWKGVTVYREASCSLEVMGAEQRSPSNLLCQSCHPDQHLHQRMSKQEQTLLVHKFQTVPEE